MSIYQNLWQALLLRDYSRRKKEKGNFSELFFRVIDSFQLAGHIEITDSANYIHQIPWTHSEYESILYTLTESDGGNVSNKEYAAKYRKLKRVYERELGKEIADITWYRTVSILKQHFSFNVLGSDAQKIVETFAGFKRRYGSFTGRGEGFSERWEAFKHFYEMDAQYHGEEFMKLLADYLKINLDHVPRSTPYYWFEKAELSFSAENIYHCKDLALVAFVAAKWAINRRAQPMKSATIEVLTLAL